MRYIFALLLTATLTVCGLALSNYLIDPANVFHDDAVGPELYAEKLVASAFGLWWPENSFEDRRIKKALTKFAPRFDCVVVGSSHVMQISANAETRLQGLGDACHAILNLGVSGATLEDHITLTYLALHEARPRYVILGVDPWLLSWGKSQAWSYYANEFGEAKTTILSQHSTSQESSTSTTLNRVASLFSLAYTLQSLRKVSEWVADPSERRAINLAPSLNASVGGEHPAFRPDGSLIYSARYLADAAHAKIPLGGQTYMTSGNLNQSKAIDDYLALLRWIRAKGSEPILLLTPYHENVLKVAESNNSVAIRATEPIVRQVAKRENVRIIGSYDPVRAGCEPTEFLDFMHPSPSCLARLK